MTVLQSMGFPSNRTSGAHSVNPYPLINFNRSLSSIKETANKHVSSKLEKLIGE